MATKSQPQIKQIDTPNDNYSQDSQLQDSESNLRQMISTKNTIIVEKSSANQKYTKPHCRKAQVR